jgi:hypothetical protein
MFTYCEVDVSSVNTLAVEGPNKHETDGVRVILQPRGMEGGVEFAWVDVPGALPLTVWNLTPEQARWIGEALLNAVNRNTHRGL